MSKPIEVWASFDGSGDLYAASTDEKHAEHLMRFGAQNEHREGLHLIHLVEAPRWIPVAERLPEPDTRVLVYAFGIARMEVRIAWTVHGRWVEDGDPAYDVTHWQPLPEPPEGT